MAKNYEYRDIAQEVTDRFIAAFEANPHPWSRPWDPAKCPGPQAPVNAATGKLYRGINNLLLGLSPAAFLSGDPRWVGWGQAKAKGWRIKEGEEKRYTGIIFYKSEDYEDKETGEEKTRMILKGHHVYHASQIDGIAPHKPVTAEEAPWTRPDAVATILKNSRAVIRIGGDRAFYAPDLDFIQLPPDSAFKGPEYWSATAAHEAAHWTSAPSRLNREISTSQASKVYHREEAIADMGAALICTTLNLPTDYENHANYVAHWLPSLRSDKREIFRVIKEAQKVSDYLLAFHPDYAASLKTQQQPAPEQNNTREAFGARRGEAAARPAVA